MKWRFMKTLNPYLTFNGQCQYALDFYCHVFSGKVTVRQTFGQAPNAVKGINPSHIMHAEFKAEAIYFMANDGTNHEPKGQNNIVLNVNFSDLEEQKTCFEALSQNGTIIMPLEKTFWGASFGKIEDQFGIQWTLNCHIQTPA
jgi:PhnB protein